MMATPRKKSVKRKIPAEGQLRELVEVEMDEPVQYLYPQDYFEGGVYRDYKLQRREVIDLVRYALVSAPEYFEFQIVREIGCAYGHALNWLADRDILGYGYDISPFAINEGRKLYPALGQLLQVSDITEDSSLIDIPVSTVFGWHVLEHVIPSKLPAVMVNMSKAKRAMFVVACEYEGREVEYCEDPTRMPLQTWDWWRDFFSSYDALDLKVMESFKRIVRTRSKRDWGERMFALRLT